MCAGTHTGGLALFLRSNARGQMYNPEQEFPT